MDDASDDGSPDMVTRDFPRVKLLRNPRNVGFGETVNHGVAEARGDYLVLLNNDLVPRQEMIREMVEPLREDAELFGVGGKTIEWAEQKPNHVNMAGRWENGQMLIVPDDPVEISSAMFLQGGSSAYRLSAFRQLGCFPHVYSPGYWEDYDMSYLALKAGWRNLYNPRAVGHHLGQGSMRRKYSPEWLWKIRMRNYFFFVWMNITDEDLFEEHLESLPGIVYRGFRRKAEDRDYLRGLALAIRDLEPVKRERARRLNLARRSDREILAEFQDHGRGCNPKA